MPGLEPGGACHVAVPISRLLLFGLSEIEATIDTAQKRGFKPPFPPGVGPRKNERCRVSAPTPFPRARTRPMSHNVPNVPLPTLTLTTSKVLR
jgi:hypothetical protein